jgi:hypothetical protein
MSEAVTGGTSGASKEPSPTISHNAKEKSRGGFVALAFVAPLADVAQHQAASDNDKERVYSWNTLYLAAAQFDVAGTNCDSVAGVWLARKNRECVPNCGLDVERT